MEVSSSVIHTILGGFFLLPQYIRHPLNLCSHDCTDMTLCLPNVAHTLIDLNLGSSPYPMHLGLALYGPTL